MDYLVRHLPSKEVWLLCMERLRQLRGPDARERDLADILGFEHSRSVRWKTGAMYVDRAESLMHLAETLEIEPMVLVNVAAGVLDAAAAWVQIDGGQAKATAGIDEPPARPRTGAERLVLVIMTDPEIVRPMVAANEGLRFLPTRSLIAGVAAAESRRPELVLLDMDLARALRYEACRVLAGIRARSGARTRVVALTRAQRDDEAVAVAAAGGVTLVGLEPVDESALTAELRRLA